MGLNVPSRVRIPPSPLPSLRPLHRDELELLVAALDGLLGDRAVPAHVDLVVDDLLLQRRRLAGEHRALGAHRGRADAVAQAEDLEVVLGVALVDLLLEAHADLGMRRHEDPGLRAVDAGLPAARAALDLAVLLQRGGRLAQVPDVPVGVLRVPVRRALLEAAVDVYAVVDDGGLHALDRLLAMRDREDVAHLVAILLAPRRED